MHDPLEPEYSILKQRVARRLAYEKADPQQLSLVDITKAAERVISTVRQGEGRSLVRPLSRVICLLMQQPAGATTSISRSVLRAFGLSMLCASTFTYLLTQ